MINKQIKLYSIITLIFILCLFALAPVLMLMNNAETDRLPNSENLLNNTELSTLPSIDQLLDVDLLDKITVGAAQVDDLISVPTLFTGLAYTEFFTIEACTDYLNEVNAAIEQINSDLDQYDFTEEAIKEMQTELTRLQEVANSYKYDIDCYTTWQNEHYYAAKVWEFLRLNGYSNEVTCGIIGNMMIETSWYSLDLNPTLYDKRTGTYYGICQWSNKYYPTIQGASFEEQLIFLEDTIQPIFKSFGKLYYAGFTYEDFKSLTDPAEAALAFATVYERCRPVTFSNRQQTAMIAYNYFVK